MRRVIIESPYRGANQSERLRNVSYLKKCLRDSLLRGEAPFASHGLYPGALDEEKERNLGIEAGYMWWPYVSAIVFYTDYGWSDGMKAAYQKAWNMGKVAEERRLNENNQHS